MARRGSGRLPTSDREDTTANETQNAGNNLEALLQGFERIARAAAEADQRRPQDENNFFNLYTSFSSLRPPNFDGTGDFMAAENWLAGIKDKFRLVRAPEENKVELATHFLEGHARFWWQETQRRFDGDLQRLPWEWFEQQFEGRYMDVMARETLRQRFTNLKQGGSSVGEYNSRFENLMRYAPDIVNNEFRLRQQYLGGLNPRLAQLVDIPGVNRLPELMLRATTTESYDARIGQAGNPRNVKPRIEGATKQGQQKESNLEGMMDYSKGEAAWCKRCQRPHSEAQCRYLNGLCHNCSEPGHFARECPHPDTRRVVDQQTRGAGRGVVMPQPSSRGNNVPQHGGQMGSRGGGRIGVHSHSCCCTHKASEEGAKGATETTEVSTERMTGNVQRTEQYF